MAQEFLLGAFDGKTILFFPLVVSSSSTPTVPGIKFRILHLPGRRGASELHPQACSFLIAGSDEEEEGGAAAPVKCWGGRDGRGAAA